MIQSFLSVDLTVQLIDGRVRVGAGVINPLKEQDRKYCNRMYQEITSKIGILNFSKVIFAYDYRFLQ